MLRLSLHGCSVVEACPELAWLMASPSPGALATVVATWGSAPRQSGAHLAVRDDGSFTGSVSGGCVEGAVIAEALAAIRDGRHRLLRYGIADAMAWEAGLACGGQIEILVQPVSDPLLPRSLLAACVEALSRGRRIAVHTNLSSGASHAIDAPAPLRTNRSADALIAVYQPPLRLAIIGAAHIARHLLELAGSMAIETLLIDPRSAFLERDDFAGATRSGDWPDEALRNWGIAEGSAVVALSHDPKIDDPALAEALRSPAFYIAALGSKKSHAARRERLAALGFDDAALARIHGPAGLSIGAQTPAEIALSILAQLIAVRRGQAG